jgi:hypothetical protein
MNVKRQKQPNKCSHSPQLKIKGKKNKNVKIPISSTLEFNSSRLLTAPVFGETPMYFNPTRVFQDIDKWALPESAKDAINIA